MVDRGVGWGGVEIIGERDKLSLIGDKGRVNSVQWSSVSLSIGILHLPSANIQWLTTLLHYLREGVGGVLFSFLTDASKLYSFPFFSLLLYFFFRL